MWLGELHRTESQKLLNDNSIFKETLIKPLKHSMFQFMHL